MQSYNSNNLENKSKSLDGVFKAVDNFSNAIAVVGDRVVDGVAGMVSSFFHKRRKRKDEEEDYE